MSEPCEFIRKDGKHCEGNANLITGRCGLHGRGFVVPMTEEVRREQARMPKTVAAIRECLDEDILAESEAEEPGEREQAKKAVKKLTKGWPE